MNYKQVAYIGLYSVRVFSCFIHEHSASRASEITL